MVWQQKCCIQDCVLCNAASGPTSPVHDGSLLLPVLLGAEGLRTNVAPPQLVNLVLRATTETAQRVFP